MHNYVQTITRVSMILKAMSHGIPIQIKDIIYGMVLGYDVGIIYDGEHISPLSYYEIGAFARLVETLSEDEWIVIAGNIALNMED